jgi:hypothetical protein
MQWRGTEQEWFYTTRQERNQLEQEIFSRNRNVLDMHLHFTARRISRNLSKTVPYIVEEGSVSQSG